MNEAPHTLLGGAAAWPLAARAAGNKNTSDRHPRTRPLCRRRRKLGNSQLCRTGLRELGYVEGHGTNLPDLARHTAQYVDKILKGANPADLPVQQPTKFELAPDVK